MHHRITYMYINFQQNWVCRSVKPCTQSYLHNIVSCIDLQLPIVIWKKIIILDMHHHKTYMCINFQHNRVETQVVTVLTSLFAKKIASCINLQLPILFFENITLSDMNHRRTYMHINFQQNWVSRSVKTVHTNLFAQYRKLHKFATTNSNFEENQHFWICIIIKQTCISIFSNIGLKHKS